MIAPSSSPSRLDPQSPMKTDAGWKLWTRKPSAAPQVIAREDARAVAPEVERDDREGGRGDRAHAGGEAVDAVGEVDDVHQRDDAEHGEDAAGSPEVDAVDERQRDVVDAHAGLHEDSAAATWPSSLAAGRQVAPVVDRADRGDQRRAGEDRRASRCCRAGTSSAPASTPAKIARPPSSGVASRASPRSFMPSTAPIRRASRGDRAASARRRRRGPRGSRGRRRPSCGRRGSQERTARSRAGEAARCATRARGRHGPGSGLRRDALAVRREPPLRFPGLPVAERRLRSAPPRSPAPSSRSATDAGPAAPGGAQPRVRVAGAAVVALALATPLAAAGARRRRASDRPGRRDAARARRSIAADDDDAGGGPAGRARRETTVAARPRVGAARARAARPGASSEGDEIAPGRTVLRRLGGGRRYEVFLVWDDAPPRGPGRQGAAAGPGDGRRPRCASSRARPGRSPRSRIPCIVRCFDAVLDGRCPHLLIEHLEGPTLRELIEAAGPPSLEQLLPLALHLASALHYMAAEGWVHLDVKPENVVMGAPPRLIDLSVARTLDRARRLGGPTGTTPTWRRSVCAAHRGGDGVGPAGRRVRARRDALPRAGRRAALPAPGRRARVARSRGALPAARRARPSRSRAARRRRWRRARAPPAWQPPTPADGGRPRPSVARGARAAASRACRRGLVASAAAADRRRGQTPAAVRAPRPSSAYSG